MKQTTIFIIDDDLVSQFATRYCIEQYDKEFNIVACGSAEEGLRVCANLLDEKEELPDIILLDLVMGDMNGWAFIENLELLTGDRKKPEIYVLSAFVNSKDRAIAKQHSLISGYFDKPLTKSSLNKIFSPKAAR
ncbi:response regulator [Allomuricauda sp. SCSIO 65647]|uniref:response regulator n=1 Tax=Allomuricauda sp. SCSIO 65647 TaxID=2908843 RepID=UPI001F442964|nr:response regulator [Muricauda sp. SCSIO 65647]UJH68752.1 response regulator [Muricauda sp. SCSIO 65647]